MICPNCKNIFSSICLKCGYDPKTSQSKFTPEELGMKKLPHVPLETVHIWLGTFRSRAALDSHFAEEIHEDGKTPMNAFAADQGKVFYNHDWLERSFEASGDIRSLIAGHSYSESYLEDVIEAAANRGVTMANTFIMADVREFPAPRSISKETYEFWYLGEFSCAT